MPSAQDMYSSPRTFSRDAVADPDGLKTAAATPTTDQVYEDAELDGVEASLLKAGAGPARTISVTTSASVGTYRTGSSFPIVVNGLVNGEETQEELLLTAANGGETIKGSTPFDQILSIDVPGQVNGSGQFSFGVQELVAPRGGVFRAVKGHAAGDLELRYQSVKGETITDTLPVKELVLEPVEPEAILETTAIGVTVYF